MPDYSDIHTVKCRDKRVKKRVKIANNLLGGRIDWLPVPLRSNSIPYPEQPASRSAMHCTVRNSALRCPGGELPHTREGSA